MIRRKNKAGAKEVPQWKRELLKSGDEADDRSPQRSGSPGPSHEPKSQSPASSRSRSSSGSHRQSPRRSRSRSRSLSSGRASGGASGCAFSRCWACPACPSRTPLRWSRRRAVRARSAARPRRPPPRLRQRRKKTRYQLCLRPSPRLHRPAQAASISPSSRPNYPPPPGEARSCTRRLS